MAVFNGLSEAARQRILDQLHTNTAALELYALCRSMQSLARRIGRFREAHNSCATTGPRRCLLCVYLDSDFEGYDAHDQLAAVQATLVACNSFIDTDRPTVRNEDEEATS